MEDDNDPGWTMLSDQEIIEEVQVEIDPESELDSESHPTSNISSTKALEGIENYLKWLENQKFNNKPDLLKQAHQMLELAREKQHSN